MKFSKIKLTSLSANAISSNELDAVRGGLDYCGCSCAYPEYAPSSDNSSFNSSSGYISTSGCNQYVGGRGGQVGNYYPDVDASIPL